MLSTKWNSVLPNNLCSKISLGVHLLTIQTKKTCFYLSTWQQAATQALRLRWINWEQILKKENQCPLLGKKNRIKAEGHGVKTFEACCMDHQCLSPCSVFPGMEFPRNNASGCAFPIIPESPLQKNTSELSCLPLGLFQMCSKLKTKLNMYLIICDV